MKCCHERRGAARGGVADGAGDHCGNAATHLSYPRHESANINAERADLKAMC